MIHDDYKVVTMQHPDPKLNKLNVVSMLYNPTTDFTIYMHTFTYVHTFWVVLQAFQVRALVPGL